MAITGDRTGLCEEFMDTYDDLHDEIDHLESVEGITALSVTLLPDPVGPLLRKLIRQGSMTVEEVAAELGIDSDAAQHLGNHLAAKGYLREEEHETEGTIYRVYLARIRKQSIPLDL
jgi:hypothetical protein